MKKHKKSSSSIQKISDMKNDFKAILSLKKSTYNNLQVKEIKTQENNLKIENKGIRVLLTKAILWNLFKKAYQMNTKRVFQQTPNAIANVAPLIEYFVRDNGFFHRKGLITQLGTLKLQPSFEKGLLIIGGYGNGKTSIMEALHLVFENYQMPMRFKTYKAHDLVTAFERIGADQTYRESSKYQFYQNLTSANGLYIDDVKKEREASNYGKVNLIRDILEKRYDQKKGRTYITCNYREGDQHYNLEDALAEFGEKYGGHIYDRLFEMFNIIEFKGDTFRR